MSEDDEGHNIVDFPSDPHDVEISIGPWQPTPRAACRHKRVKLREEGSQYLGNVSRRRVAVCAKCGDYLDPLDVLWRYAKSDDKLRRQAKAWEELDASWEWIWDNSATISISRAAGVRGAIKVNGKRRTRKASACARSGIAGLITGTVKALKQLKKWETRS